MRLLITGINGLIGTILHRALREQHEVYGLDQEGPFSDRVVTADIAEYGQLAGVLNVAALLLFVAVAAWSTLHPTSPGGHR